MGSCMWQKKIYLGLIIIISGIFSQVYAQTIEVQSLNDFSTAKPPKSISVKLLEPLNLTSSMKLDLGTTINGDLIDVVSPKRLKRDASFSLKVKSYKDLDGKIYNLKDTVIASYTVPVDKTGLAKNAALSVGNYFVKGLSIGVAAIQGAVNNDEDNVIKSSAVSAYEASPLSYVQKGEDLNINEYGIFFLKFPDIVDNQNSDNKGQNYSYNIEKKE